MTGMGIHLLDAFSFLVGPMARVSALSTRRILPFEVGRHHAGDARVPQRRDRHDRDLAEDAGLRVAAARSTAPRCGRKSLCETKVTLCRRDGKPETFEVPQTNHIGANLEFVRRAPRSGKAKFQIDDDGIVHTVAALEAVFDSAERNGAWRDIA